MNISFSGCGERNGTPKRAGKEQSYHKKTLHKLQRVRGTFFFARNKGRFLGMRASMPQYCTCLLKNRPPLGSTTPDDQGIYSKVTLKQNFTKQLAQPNFGNLFSFSGWYVLGCSLKFRHCVTNKRVTGVHGFGACELLGSRRTVDTPFTLMKW